MARRSLRYPNDARVEMRIEIKNLISERVEWCQLQDGFLQMSET